MRPFDCDHVERFFDDADFGAVPLQVAANDALLRFAEVGAGFTENNFVLDAVLPRGGSGGTAASVVRDARASASGGCST